MPDAVEPNRAPDEVGCGLPMRGLDRDVLHSAIDWIDRGHRVTLGTVVRTWGSAPRPPGSLMALRDDGQVAGSVSGGCIEDDLIARVARGEFAAMLPQLATYGANADEAQRFGLPCGGTVQVVLEPLSARSQLRELQAAITAHRRVERQLDLATGVVRLRDAGAGDALRFDGARLVTVHGPRLRLLIIGGGQLARCLATMALMLDYRVTVCEPRVEYRQGWQALADVTVSSSMPDDLVLAMHLDANSAVVALTHDPKLDDLALMEALRTPAFYVGALGSRRNNDARRARLQQFEVSLEESARLRGPVGLRLGGLTAPEIAAAIVAEMIAVRRGARVAGPLADWSDSSRVCRVGAAG